MELNVKEDVPNNAFRERIMSRVKEGQVNFKELMSLLSIEYASVNHHVKALQREGKVSVKDIHNVSYVGLPIVYPILVDNNTRKNIIATLNKATTTVDKNTYNGLSRAELAKRLEITPTGIESHIKVLHADGLVMPPIKVGRLSLTSLIGDLYVDARGYVHKDGKPFYGKNSSIRPTT